MAFFIFAPISPNGIFERFTSWFKLKSRIGKKPPTAPGRPGYPPAFPQRQIPRPMALGARPVMMRPIARRIPPTTKTTKTDKELEETLKKLKEMSK